MNDGDEEQQSLIHSHELKIQQQESTIEKLEERLIKHEKILESLHVKPTVKSDDDRAARSSISGQKDNTDEQESEVLVSDSSNLPQDRDHELAINSNIREELTNRMKAMEEAHLLAIVQVKEEMKTMLQSSTQNTATEPVPHGDPDQVEIVALSNRVDNDEDEDGTNPDITSNTSPDADSSRRGNFARRLVFSLFSNVTGGRSHLQTNSPQGDSTSFEYALDEDTYSLMMISRPCSREWLLGLITFLVFQIWLEFLILNTLFLEYIGFSGSNDLFLVEILDSTVRVPFNVPLNPSLEVTAAQGIAITLVLATQSDILTSIHTFSILRMKNDNVPWDRLIGEEGNRSFCLWVTRILIPNLAKLIQGIIILFVSFVIIVQSTYIIDLLKDFTSLLVVSQADNILFNLADAGYLGKHLAMKAREVRTRRIQIGSRVDANTTPDVNTGSNTRDGETTSLKRKCITSCSFFNAFNVRFVLFAGGCIGMIYGWALIVHGQYSGNYARLKYPECNIPTHAYSLLGNRVCSDFFYDSLLNTAECGWDGGDCPSKELVEAFPGCRVYEPFRIGNGVCDDIPPNNTPECNYDGGDCPTHVEVDEVPGCFVSYPELIGNGRCDWEELPYNSPECNHDGGDCIAEGYPECNVPNPFAIGNGYCSNYPPYNTLECGYDGGDCSSNQSSSALAGSNLRSIVYFSASTLLPIIVSIFFMAYET